jgi:hypothetical protein
VSADDSSQSMSVLCISTAIHPPLLLPETLLRPLRALCFLTRAPAGSRVPLFARWWASAVPLGQSCRLVVTLPFLPAWPLVLSALQPPPQLVRAEPPFGSRPVLGWLFLGRPADVPAAAGAADAAPAAATFSSADPADVAVLHQSLWAGLSGAAGAAVPCHVLWAGCPPASAPLLPWLCRPRLL